MKKSMKIVLNLPYLFERCVNKYDTMIALRKTCRNMYRLIEWKTFDRNSMEHSNFKLTISNYRLDDGIFCCKLHQGPNYLTHSELKEEIENLTLPNMLYGDCLRICFDCKFDKERDYIHGLSKTKLNDEGSFLMKTLEAIKLILHKFPNFKSMEFQQEGSDKYNEKKELCNLFYYLITFMNPDQITRFTLKYDNLLEMHKSFPTMSWNFKNLEVINIRLNPHNSTISEEDAQELTTMISKLDPVEFEFSFNWHRVPRNFYFYNYAIKLINDLKLKNLKVPCLQKPSFSDIYDTSTYIITPHNEKLEKQSKSPFQEKLYISTLSEESFSSINLQQIYVFLKFESYDVDSRKLCQNILLSAPNTLSFIKATLDPYLTMPFAKQIAERYPNIKALGIGGVEKEESGKCFTDFTNLEVIIARSIKAQLIIPTSVRVVVQKIAAAKTNNDCIFIDQEDGSKITFNNICVFGVRRTNIDRKVYVRTIADLELYKEIHAFVETCLFDTDDTDLDTDNDVNEFGNYYDYYDEYDAMYNDSDGSDEFGLGYYHN